MDLELIFTNDPTELITDDCDYNTAKFPSKDSQ